MAGKAVGKPSDAVIWNSVLNIRLASNIAGKLRDTVIVNRLKAKNKCLR
jgi:hypothetical protein